MDDLVLGFPEIIVLLGIILVIYIGGKIIGKFFP